MAMQKVVCPFCDNDWIVFNGKDRHGNQRCLCRACGRTFPLQYKYNGARPEADKNIVEMAMNGAGVRDTARFLEVSKDKVISTLRDLYKQVQYVNRSYLDHLDPTVPIECDIVIDADFKFNDLEEIKGLEVEIDEMWSFYQSKKQEIWLWWLVDHSTNKPVAFIFGDKKDCNLKRLLNLVKDYNITMFYGDGNRAYNRYIPKDKLTVSKKNTQQIERNHLTLRTRLKRLARKTICFSKDLMIHIAVVGTFIDMYFFHSYIV